MSAAEITRLRGLMRYATDEERREMEEQIEALKGDGSAGGEKHASSLGLPAARPMAQQHDAPDLVFSHYEDDQPVFMPRSEALAPTPPAPSGLVDAVRAYLAASDAVANVYAETPHLSSEEYAVEADRRMEAKRAARATLDATLSGQQGGAVPETYWKGDVALVGPVDGMNEKHPEGSYFRLVAMQGEEKRLQILFSRGAVEALRDELIGALEKVGRGQQGGAVPAGDRRLSGLDLAADIANHWHQRFLVLRDEETKGNGRWNRLQLNAEGAAHVLAEIRAERARLAEQPATAIPTDTDFKRLGWAPGSYEFICAFCGLAWEGDKRATCCESCATKRWNAEQPVPAGTGDAR